MKPKYKLGQLVEFKTGDTSLFHDVITGILTTSTGFSYQTHTGKTGIREEDIVQAYKALKGKKTKTKTARAPRKARAVTTDPMHPTGMSS